MSKSLKHSKKGPMKCCLGQFSTLKFHGVLCDYARIKRNGQYDPKIVKKKMLMANGKKKSDC